MVQRMIVEHQGYIKLYHYTINISNKRLIFLFYSCVYFDKTRLPLVVDKYGVNSGLLFMKLDDLRRFDFVKKIIEIRRRSKFRIIGDQDMINILFYNQTGKKRIYWFWDVILTFMNRSKTHSRSYQTIWLYIQLLSECLL